MTKQHNYYLLFCKAQHSHYYTWTTNYITQVSPVTDGCIKLLLNSLLSPMLKLSLETSYCNWNSLQFPSVPPGKCTSMSSPIHFSLIICHSLLYIPGYWQHYPIKHKGSWLLNEASHFTWYSTNFKLWKITCVSALIRQNTMRTCEEAIV